MTQKTLALFIFKPQAFWTSMVLKRTLVLSYLGLSRRLLLHCLVVWLRCVAWVSQMVMPVKSFSGLKRDVQHHLAPLPGRSSKLFCCFGLHVFFPYFFWVPYHVFHKQCQNKALVSFDGYVYIHHHPFSRTSPRMPQWQISCCCFCNSLKSTQAWGYWSHHC